MCLQDEILMLCNTLKPGINLIAKSFLCMTKFGHVSSLAHFKTKQVTDLVRILTYNEPYNLYCA